MPHRIFTRILLDPLGFTSIADFINSLVRHGSLCAGLVFGALHLFITRFIWDDPKQLYILYAMLALDLITGVIKAVKKGEFSSRRLPRWAAQVCTYTMVLGMGMHFSHVSPLLVFVPSAIMGILMATAIYSNIENAKELGWLDKRTANILLSIFSPSKILDLLRKAKSENTNNEQDPLI